MNAAGAGDQRAQPSEEELREYAKQLRSLPVERVVADTVLALLNGAQAKLGRRDARLLIDLATVSLEHAREYLSKDLAGRIDSMLGQLRLAQVTAEGQRKEPEENDLDRVPAPPNTGQAAQSTSTPRQAPATPSPASKLWVPGR